MFYSRPRSGLDAIWPYLVFVTTSEFEAKRCTPAFAMASRKVQQKSLARECSALTSAAKKQSKKKIAGLVKVKFDWTTPWYMHGELRLLHVRYKQAGSFITSYTSLKMYAILCDSPSDRIERYKHAWNRSRFRWPQLVWAGFLPAMHTKQKKR